MEECTMANCVWISHGTCIEGKLVKQEHLHWGQIDVSENDTIYSTLIRWYCREPHSSFVYLTGRHLGGNNTLDIPPKQIAWNTRMDTLGESPCLLIVSYFTAIQYGLFGRETPVDEKTE